MDKNKMISRELVNHWLYNLINDKINDEILLLVLPKDGRKRNLKESFGKLKADNYELIEISSIESINELEKNKNIIILGHPWANMYLLNNLQHCILYSSWKDLPQPFLSNEHIKNIKKYSTKKSITERDRFMCFYEKRNPFILLNPSDRSLVLDYAIHLLRQNPPFNFTKLVFLDYYYKYKGKPHVYTYTLSELIEEDISYLLRSDILTARLAIFIYKVATFKFDDSSTKIGKYYREKLGLTSKTVRLPHVPGRTVKAYDLTNYFNTTKN